MGLIARSATAYLAVLKKLLPRGRAWAAAPDSDMEKVLLGVADEAATADADILAMADQFIPDKAGDDLELWESALALPEPEVVQYGITQTTDVRAEVVKTKLAMVGNLGSDFYTEVLASYGVTASFATLYTPGLYAGGPCNTPCGVLANAFYVGITIQPTALDHGFIEALMRRLLPAYVIPIYTYL